MANTSQITREAQLEELEKGPGFLRKTFSLFRKQPLGIVGAAIVFGMLLVGILAPLIAPYDPIEVAFENMLLPPSSDYWMGTDQFGRDIFSRLLYGAQTALFVSFFAAFTGSSIGLVLGVTSAYIGGRFDLLIQRGIDVFQAFPLIIMRSEERRVGKECRSRWSPYH